MERYDEYKKHTKEANWVEICKLSNINERVTSDKKVLLTLPEHLLENEVVFAFTQGITRELKTGSMSLIVLTNERFILLEKGVFFKSRSVQSINLLNVSAVTAIEGWFMGKLSIDLGARIIRIDSCLKNTVSIVANIANRCIQDLKNKKNVGSQVALHHEETPLEKLEKLANHHKMGALSDEEFNTEKQKLLTKV